MGEYKDRKREFLVNKTVEKLERLSEAERKKAIKSLLLFVPIGLLEEELKGGDVG